MLRVKTLFESKPGSTFCSSIKLRTSRPAPINNITATALSNTTSKLRVRFRNVPSAPRAPSFNESMRSTFNERAAGARPNKTPVTIEIRSVKPSTVASIVTFTVAGRLSSLKLTSSSTPHLATNAPNAPPRIESIKLSVIICRTIRHRLAPSAVRKAISFCLAAARTSKRFATFAHAMSNTNPTAPKRMKTIVLLSPTNCSRNETRPRLHPLLVSGNCCSS